MLYFFLQSRISSVTIVNKMRANRPKHHGSIPSKGKKFFSFPKTLYQPWDPFSLLFTYHEMKSWLKMSVPLPPVPHTPSQRVREKRYILPAYSFITVLSKQVRNVHQKVRFFSSMTSVLMRFMVFF